MESLSQRVRLFIFTLYVVTLLVVSRVTVGDWLPPSSSEGLWFYGGLFPLLLGHLIVSPFFTKPADALTYGITGLVALIAADVAFNDSRESFERALWIAAMAYMSTVSVASLASMTSRTATSAFGSWLSSASYRFADTYGAARPVYFTIFLLALLIFHRNSAVDFGVLLSTGVVILVVRPLEIAWALGASLLRGWQGLTAPRSFLGELLARQEPGIMLVRRDPGSDVHPGDIVVGRTADREVHFGLHLDWLWLAGETWARIARLRTTLLTREERELLGRQAGSGRGVTKLIPSVDSQEAYDKLLRIHIVDRKDKLVGIVAPDTNLGTLVFEVTGVDTDIEEGQLVETRIGNKSVLYQIIDAVSREELLQERNSYGYVRAKARKVGVWSEDLRRFEKVKWIPLVNEPVLLVSEEKPEPEAGVIGHFPKTRFPVIVQMHPLVTQNTAILGILGSGKTMLALELVQRMMREGIKVICLDITGQYADRLRYKEHRTAMLELKRTGVAGRTQYHKNVEEGGSIRQFRRLLRKYLSIFLSEGCAENLLILDPGEFEVWQQESKPYQNVASMGSLTPTEITRVITEQVLEELQLKGTAEGARACVVFEEAHSLIPEWNSVAAEGDRTATNGTAKAILQGRKYGLGCLLITQRTANVTKSVLNQCNTVFALRLYDATGMEFLRNYIGDDFAGVLSTLEDRHAVIFGRASSCADPVLVRLNDREDFLKVFGQ